MLKAAVSSIIISSLCIAPIAYMADLYLTLGPHTSLIDWFYICGIGSTSGVSSNCLWEKWKK
jgi:hypothetical protein